MKPKTKKQTKAELFNSPRCFVLRDYKPKGKGKVARALSGNGLTRSDSGGYSEFSYGNPKEPIVIIDKETSCVNHAHQDTWTGIKTFTHYRLRKQRRP